MTDDPIPGFGDSGLPPPNPAEVAASLFGDTSPMGWDTGPGPDKTRVALVVAEGSPRASQIATLLAAHGMGDRLVLMPTPEAQLADLFEPVHARIAKAFAVPPDLLLDTSARVSQAMIDLRARRLSAQIDEALLSGRGFPSAAEAMRQMAGAAQRFGAALREAGWRWPVQVEEPRLSKRRRRRLRGRAKEARRC